MSSSLTALSADFILTCDDEFNILRDATVVFGSKILGIGSKDDILAKYPQATHEQLPPNSIILPGLINSHVHLEFSANKTSLEYGGFIKWLRSVILKRDDLIPGLSSELINQNLNQMLKTGTTTIGAISSYSADMQECVESKLNVVYFNEIIGTKPDMVDTLFSDFQARLESSLKHKSDSFIPAIAIHSAYSVHPFLLREVLKIARAKDLKVSAHFLESLAEREWLDDSSGDFREFFEEFFNSTSAVTTIDEFLAAFKDIKDLSFTHCVELSQKETTKLQDLQASIIHCPKSNRLLTNKTLQLKDIESLNIAMGTDGLSSNNSLSMLDELRDALWIHKDIEPNLLAQKLIHSATNAGAKALGLDKGILSVGKDADIITIELPDALSCTSSLALQTLLHTKEVSRTYIQGEFICLDT
jgi:cytosine/adenosine deaminase-related metal-dependent hydrolase